VAFGALRGVLAAALDEVDGLRAFDLVDHFGLDCGACHEGHADGAVHHQDFVELDFLASDGIKLFHAQNVTRLHFILLAACFQDRKGHSLFSFIARVLRPLWPDPGRWYSWFPRLRTAHPSPDDVQKESTP